MDLKRCDRHKYPPSFAFQLQYWQEGLGRPPGHISFIDEEKRNQNKATVRAKGVDKVPSGALKQPRPSHITVELASQPFDVV